MQSQSYTKLPHYYNHKPQNLCIKLSLKIAKYTVYNVSEKMQNKLPDPRRINSLYRITTRGIRKEGAWYQPADRWQ